MRAWLIGSMVLMLSGCGAYSLFQRVTLNERNGRPDGEPGFPTAETGLPPDTGAPDAP